MLLKNKSSKTSQKKANKEKIRNTIIYITPHPIIKEKAESVLDLSYNILCDEIAGKLRATRSKLPFIKPDSIVKPSIRWFVETYSNNIAGFVLPITYYNTINLNYSFICNNYFWDTVIKHEFAHVLTGQIFASYGKPHGKEFKFACKLLNVSSEAFHDMYPVFESAHPYIKESYLNMEQDPYYKAYNILANYT